ncbi:peptidoglycan DD-metalloendopeptidase family protein [Candidatus Pacebacteria bacterium]|nr:peptidoglycan DD-metalloendopeptidase family protein [Candidatus Paceibacterota bacterium]
MTRRSVFAFFFGLLVIPLLSLGTDFAWAQSEIDRLQAEISERSDRLGDIEAEILRYEAALQEVGAEKDTLQKAINTLSLERNKVLADISYTENQISNTDLEINKLILEIRNAERDIGQNQQAMKDIIRNLHVIDDDALIEVLLRHDSLSEFWNDIADLETIKAGIQDQVYSLVSLKGLLENKHNTETTKRGELIDLKDKYDGQQQVLSNNQAEKDKLLEETASEEARYQALLAEKKAAREQLTAELRSFEAELQFILDPNTIPPRGTAVFAWPLQNIIITQYFGGTEFAKNNPGIYGRGYHPGVDFGASVGTPIYAPLSGTVRWIDDTDAVPGCYAWGKWTLIDHANGLSTLYAHQSAIPAHIRPGASVGTGDLIGYVGATGYVTGPHLHFTVYAKDAVEVIRYSDFKTVTSCGPAYTPRAASEGYIDPMAYLPAF